MEKQSITKDFFISYNKADRVWAEWIAWQLEAEGYSAILQAWDFSSGADFILQMHKAAEQSTCTLAVLSPDYLTAQYTKLEWAAALAQDPTGEKGALLLVRVRECDLTGILRSRVYIDLVSLEETAARKRFLEAVRLERGKPGSAPHFPGVLQHVAPYPQNFPRNWPLIWNVPYRRNPFFTGREELLRTLHERLSSTETVALTQTYAISGLGGIGKTQTALEYAYRHRQVYQAVLWVRATASDTLVSDYVTIAGLLQLPEKNEPDQKRVVAAVKQWLITHKDWLLILDNADDLDIIEDFLPTGEMGHILLTTRAQATGRIAIPLAIEKMERDEGILLLLRRARVLSMDASLEEVTMQDRTRAEAIVVAMDYLPLAIEQAGAYIEQTGCGLSRYMEFYQRHRTDLLKWRRRLSADYPKTVASVWALSFEQVEQANPAAADLLRLCAFLEADAIPEEIFVEGAPALGPVLEPVAANAFLLNEAIEELRRFSLVRRNANEKALSVHRLVQVILRDGMNEEVQHQWAERAVRAVNHAFSAVNEDMKQQVQRYLPHAQFCAEIIDHYGFTFSEATRLLDQAAYFLQKRALYVEAEPLYQRSLTIREKSLGPEHLDTAQSLNNMGLLYRSQGKYEQAEPLLRRTLSIREKVLGSEHPETAESLDNLAEFYRVQGRYMGIEPQYQRALAIREKVLGPEHPDTAQTLNNLANLYRVQWRYPEAASLYQRALSIREKTLGPEHPNTAESLNNLGILYRAQKRYIEAETLLKRALSIWEKVLGPEHPDTARSLNNLGFLYRDQGKYEKALPLYQQALSIREKVLGSEHPDTAQTLNNLANLYRIQRHHSEAEALYLRALTIREKVGPEHPDTAQTLNNLANLYRIQERHSEAEALYLRALTIREKVLGLEHPNTTKSLNDLSRLYCSQGKFEQAVSLYQQALAIREKVLGPEHLGIVTVLENYSALLRSMNLDSEAELLNGRAQRIRNKDLF